MKKKKIKKKILTADLFAWNATQRSQRCFSLFSSYLFFGNYSDRDFLWWLKDKVSNNLHQLSFHSKPVILQVRRRRKQLVVASVHGKVQSDSAAADAGVSPHATQTGYSRKTILYHNDKR